MTPYTRLQTTLQACLTLKRYNARLVRGVQGICHSGDKRSLRPVSFYSSRSIELGPRLLLPVMKKEECTGLAQFRSGFELLLERRFETPPPLKQMAGPPVSPSTPSDGLICACLQAFARFHTHPASCLLRPVCRSVSSRHSPIRGRGKWQT